MLVKLLGLLDFIAVFLLLFLAIEIAIFPIFLVIIAVLLLLKGIFFFAWVGLIDVLGAIVLILSLFFAMPLFIIIIALILIFQKAVLSMF